LAQPVVTDLRSKAAINDNIRELGGEGAFERVAGQSVPKGLHKDALVVGGGETGDAPQLYHQSDQAEG
jgi:hypothetical protein